MNENDVHLSEQINSKNKKKLLQQNLRLVAELKRLQIEIEALDVVQREDKQDDSLFIALKNETQAQQRQIKKLKELIQAEKHANLKENVIYIRKEEDQLIYLKKQLQNLEIEKNLVVNAHSDKLKKLATNEPLQKHKEQLQNLWAKTKKQNRELNLKMVQMEREVRKYHKMKEISKASPSETISSSESQVAITNTEIQRLNNEMKGIQAKWKSNIDQFDRQFFTQKNVLTDFQQKILELEREEQIWKRRAGTLRDQSELASDRARLSKIVAIKNNEENKFNTFLGKKQTTLSKNIADDLQKTKKEKRQGNLATSLNRAESSPNPPTSAKRPIDIKLNDLLVPGKRQHRYNPNKERAQTSIGLINFQKAKQLKLKEVQKVRNAQILNNKVKQRSDKSISFKEQVRQQNETMSHRDKHRIKSSAASQLAEQLKRKAEEVKQLNKRLEVQELKTSKGRPKNKQSKVQVMQAELSPKNGNSKSKMQKQPQTASIQRQAYGNSPSKIQRNQSSIQNQPKNTKSIQKINKTKQLQINGEENRPKQKQLVQHLQLNIKKEKQQSPKNTAIATRKKQSISNEKQKTASISSLKILETVPVSPKAESKKHQQKPKEQVPKTVQAQLEKHKDSVGQENKDVKLRVQIELQDEEDNKPRIIKRKRPVQTSLVTSGTST